MFIGLIVNLVVGVVLSVAVSLVQQAFRQDQKQKAAGVRGTIQTGGDNPLGFILGKYAGAGQLEYAGTWGSSGDTPNAYYTKVISLSDLPVNALTGLYVNGERVTINSSSSGTKGYPIDEYKVGSKDHLWITFYDGTQTSRDSLLGSAFGSDADRPWAATHVGRGVAYAVVTALINRELFSGLPEYLFEVEGIKLYDPRKDTTAGGDGTHRLDDPTTWEWSDNPVVAIYNILCGIYYFDGVNSTWLYGPQNIAQTRLPYANWAAEMDKCDELVDLSAGGTQKRFRFGYEVTVDQEPHVVIGELLKACEGRIAEVGGIYKILVAEPDEPVKAITDEDIVISEGQSFEPFPGLESTFNGITATYPEPEEAWESKEAPPRYSTALETEDDGRRLPFSTDYKAVPHALQVQRLMQAAIDEARRFRRHSFTGPAEWWEYEPLDVFEWTSTRNGYTEKQFIVTVIEDLPNGNQVVGSQEIDPTDYTGWTTDDELTYDTVPITVARPAPQPMTGWAVAPYTLVDAEAAARRPGIEVSYAANLVDVRAVRVQVRRDGESDPFFDGEYPYDAGAASPSIYIVANAILGNEPYEARGIYVPFSGRATEWSEWLAVTTPDVKLGAKDISVEFEEIAGEIAEDLKWISKGVRQAIENFDRLGSLIAEQDLANYHDRQTLRREIEVTDKNLRASFNEIIEVAIGPGGAIATSLESLYAAMGGSTAEVLVKWGAEAAPVGVTSRWGLHLSTDNGETFGQAALLAQVRDGESEIVLAADRTVVASADGTEVYSVFDENGLMTRDITTALIKSADGASFWDLTTGAFRIST